MSGRISRHIRRARKRSSARISSCTNAGGLSGTTRRALEVERSSARFRHAGRLLAVRSHEGASEQSELGDSAQPAAQLVLDRVSRWGFEPVFGDQKVANRIANRILAFIGAAMLKRRPAALSEPDSEHLVGIR